MVFFKHYLLGGYYMKLKKLNKMCMFICALVFSSALFAEVPETQLVSQQQSSKPRTTTSKSNGQTRRFWKPYYLKLKEVEPALTSFYQQNVGIGFLRFSGIRGNLNPTNVTGAVSSNDKLVGHLMYNRTPLVEFVIGTDIYRWWKMGISYQHQGGIVVQTRPQTVVADAGGAVDLTSQVRLDAIMFKTYFVLPYVLTWLNLYNEAYLGLAVGPGWQTWIDNRTAAVGSVTLRPKFSANCVYTVDLGFKMRKALPNYNMSFTLGCKYNQWGQARYIGKAGQQYDSSTGVVRTGSNGLRAALSNPPRIITVYQFAPYVGVQFNF